MFIRLEQQTYLKKIFKEQILFKRLNAATILMACIISYVFLSLPISVRRYS